MNFLNNLKLDAWWKMILWLGLLSIIASFLFTPTFLENKHLFGLGLGLILIGISYWIATNSYSWIKPPNAYTGGTALITQKRIEHNIVTTLLLVSGITITGLFVFLIIKSLI